MKKTRRSLKAALLLWLAAPAGLAQAITLDLPSSAVPSAESSISMTSYALPVGPFTGGEIPTKRVEGPMQQTAWRIENPGDSTLNLLIPLRDQLEKDGFRTLYECDATECGGFDFRYGTVVLPEPEMHVDLGDFRYFAAERGDEVVSLIVSRTSSAGFVQMIRVGGDVQSTVLSASTMARPADTTPISAPPVVAQSPAGSLGPDLMSGGSVALDDLVFASGSSTLAAGDYASLQDLADYLVENPSLSVALVGHTDASGSLDINITLSRKRAESVRSALIARHAIDPARVEAQGVGYLSPRASNLTTDGREKNRRVEVMVTSTLP